MPNVYISLGVHGLFRDAPTTLLRHKHKLLILSHLSDFMTCCKRFNIYSEGSISQVWNTVGRENLLYRLIRHS